MSQPEDEKIKRAQPGEDPSSSAPREEGGPDRPADGEKSMPEAEVAPEEAPAPEDEPSRSSKGTAEPA